MSTADEKLTDTEWAAQTHMKVSKLARRLNTLLETSGYECSTDLGMALILLGRVICGPELADSWSKVLSIGDPICQPNPDEVSPPEPSSSK